MKKAWSLIYFLAVVTLVWYVFPWLAFAMLGVVVLLGCWYGLARLTQVDVTKQEVLSNLDSQIRKTRMELSREIKKKKNIQGRWKSINLFKMGLILQNLEREGVIESHKITIAEYKARSGRSGKEYWLTPPRVIH